MTCLLRGTTKEKHEGEGGRVERFDGKLDLRKENKATRTTNKAGKLEMYLEPTLELDTSCRC